MTEQHTVTMRFVRGASAPAPLADPATEEEAVLVSDTQAAIQRLRDAVVATVGLHPLWTTCVLRSDLATLLDALDAATARINGLLAAIEWVNEEFDEEFGPVARTFEQRAAIDNLRVVQSGQDYMTATPRAADPDAT